jgi:serine/threonine-protein kinase
MGEVFLARDTKLERQVAIKLLAAEFSQQADRLHRFTQEARAASALNHPNILTIYEIGETDGLHFIATEYIEGETLRHHIQHSRMIFREVLDILVQVASALSVAHQASIIHRDLKPENIMLRPDGYVKVLDFGLAKLSEKNTPVTSSEAATLSKKGTDPGTIMGTVQYMSPEQARGKVVDTRSDIFSLGVVLYEMIAGRAPFTGESSTDVLAAILDKEPPPLLRFVDELPTELQRIVQKCLRKERDERYQTMKGLLADLKELRDELALEAKLERSIRPASIVESQVTLIADGEKTKDQSVQPTDAATVQTTSSAEYLVSQLQRHKRGIALVLLVLLITAGGLGYWLFGIRAAGNKQIESIAVMPFVNASGNADVEYLSDGMTETLISSLSQLPKLNVKPRSSVFRYKGKDTDLPTIAKEMNVQAILNGRIMQRGEQITLSLELVDVSKDSVIWSEQYNRKQTDLVSLQSEIARDVSSKLKARLSGADAAKVEKKYTIDPLAYQRYLKGRFYWNKRTSDSLKQAVEYFHQAIEKDPNYALAYSGLAESYVLFPNYSIAAPLDSMPKAKAAALRAIELDDSLAESHVALGVYYANFAWNPPASEKEFRRAIELNPNYATGHQQFGIECLTAIGRYDEAIAEGKRAEELDPLSTIISADLGNILFRARRFDESLAQLNRTLALDPNFWVARWYLGQSFQAKGQYAESIAEYQKALAGNANPWIKAQLVRSLAKGGKRNEALVLLGELQADAVRGVVSSASLALAFGGLGDKDKAFALLDKEVADRGSRASVFAFNPLWDDLRSDPRFAELVRRVEGGKID